MLITSLPDYLSVRNSREVCYFRHLTLKSLSYRIYGYDFPSENKMKKLIETVKTIENHL